MIHPIESVQIIAADLPDYVDQCRTQAVTPLLSRPSGWTPIEAAADLVKEIDLTLIDAMYGEEELRVKSNMVVTVAVYGTVSVA